MNRNAEHHVLWFGYVRSTHVCHSSHQVNQVYIYICNHSPSLRKFQRWGTGSMHIRQYLKYKGIYFKTVPVVTYNVYTILTSGSWLHILTDPSLIFVNQEVSGLQLFD